MKLLFRQFMNIDFGSPHKFPFVQIQPLSHILMQTVMMLATAQTMENQVAIVSM